MRFGWRTFTAAIAWTRWLDCYLFDHRPLLLRGSGTPRLWISIRSTPLTDNTIYCRVCLLTKKLIGKRVNPHLFRDCVATCIAEHAPDEVKIIVAILGHSSLETGERHYNHAGMLIAHKRYLAARAAVIDAPEAYDLRTS